jgi:hypothetical protein
MIYIQNASVLRALNRHDNHGGRMNAKKTRSRFDSDIHLKHSNDVNRHDKVNGRMVQQQAVRRGGVAWKPGKLAKNVKANIDHIIARLASASQATDSPSWIASLKQVIFSSNWKDGQGAFVDDSLSSIILRCTRAESLTIGMDFIFMMNLIHLSLKVER